MHDFAAQKTMTTFAQPASTPMVLVVEDEPAIAGVLSAYLERDGLRIRMAQDGEEALCCSIFICPRSTAWTCCA